ncbi:cytochrome C biogenesis protein [Candidatus Kaiserbacteria bacterium CG10_big_fil_rev_8_21_14_0_10_56_12]|uniref:Cytochrome C biogenesis protein n=1 Tax=Candidatus Kaiserbacteria bacterium CG10_big_fil_rev_8_21_14_0_10_56_12 TaxID=1974611 RepID=A0A2H0U935_9BACT|nr:MAG: cytochrome C biogenesis protein [Candidatus Kaiserbacteria bacterium CG10_big_fil_rev_8_21_14_0_10_56_12]
MILFLISFFAGVLTVLSPCVLPLLPVIVGGSLAGSRSYRRALTVTLSLGISVFLFTFLLKVSSVFVTVPPAVWNWISGGILLLVGLFFLFPQLWDLIPGTARVNRDSNRLVSKGYLQQSFWGDVLVGAALGPVFSTCSPTYFIVLATVLPISLALGVVDILAYVLGLCLALLAIAVLGQRILDRLNIVAYGRGWFKRAIGVLFLLIGLLVITDSLAAVERPLYSIFDETKIEQYFLQRQAPTPAAGSTIATDTPQSLADEQDVGNTAAPAAAAAPALSLAQKEARYTRAPELVSPDAYLNTGGEPISLAQYRGKKVVLVDFWTYSCINCQRTLPYLTSWYKKYKDQGLVIVGVHTPEFSFEKLVGNVRSALATFGITYPVVLDNEYKTWNAFGNQYWPHKYLIDIDGFVVHDHIGEGAYDETEKAIQQALNERADRMQESVVIPSDVVPVAAPLPTRGTSPETYFGANRNEYLGNGATGTVGIQNFELPTTPAKNTLYLGGRWNIAPEYAVASVTNASIEYTYTARNVYVVASAPKGTSVKVLQDGVPLTPAQAGGDVTGAVMRIEASRLYHVVSNPGVETHTLQIIISDPGLEAYTFTFG